MLALPSGGTLDLGLGRGGDWSQAAYNYPRPSTVPYVWWPRPGSPLSAAATSAREGETGMPRRMIALLGLVLASGLITVTVAGQDRVYTVPQVLAGLTRDPQACSGHAAPVWGTALPLPAGCSPPHWCASRLYAPH